MDDWYHNLDVHAPVEDLLALLTEDGFEAHVPEGEFQGHEGFERLYDGWTHRFFDEVHKVKQLDIAPADDRADVTVVVSWQARIWDPPEAESKRLNFDAYQTWVVQRSRTSGQPVILTYIVDALKPRNSTPAYEECLA
ncbi:MAG: nuclear transport factor 2 family protein [Pseudonocardiaceae bacterium]